MKRKTKIIIFVEILSIISLVGCLVNEEWDSPMYKNIQEITVQEAKESFQASIKIFHITPKKATRTADEELLVTPLWENAEVVNFEDRRIVEIPVNAPAIGFYRIKNITDSIPQDEKYLNTTVRLIAEKGTDKNIFFTIVKITGDLKYIKQNNNKFNKTRLSGLKNFSGAIRYYTLEGELISGKRYNNGDITGTIIPHSSTKQKTQTRALEDQCEEVVYLVENYNCIDVYIGGELMHSECELVDYWIESETVCGDSDICQYCGQTSCICQDKACSICLHSPCICESGEIPEVPNSFETKVKWIKNELTKLGIDVSKLSFKPVNDCPSNARVNKNGIIEICPEFFNKAEIDQISIITHEVRHFERGHYGQDWEATIYQLNENSFDLKPPPDIDKYFRDRIDLEMPGCTKDQKDFAFDQLMHHSILLDPQYYNNEIETYIYEIGKMPNVTSKYDMERNVMLWEYQQMHEKAKQYYKK